MTDGSTVVANATTITDGDITFPNLNAAVDPNNGASGPNVADMFQTNLIMPEPTIFLDPVTKKNTGIVNVLMRRALSPNG